MSRGLISDRRIVLSEKPRRDLIGRVDSSEAGVDATGVVGEDTKPRGRGSKFGWDAEDIQIVVPGRPGVFTGDGRPVPMVEHTDTASLPADRFSNKKKLPAEQVVPGLDGATLGDFWSWAYSDILSNTNRGVFAEFVVGRALEVLDYAREEWDAVDLYYRGKKIEVKSAAYWQSWQQRRLSKIIYGIGKKLAYDAQSNTQATEPLYSADCYVFALYPEKDESKIDILDIPRWHFYVVPTAVLIDHVGELKTLSIKRLEKIVNEPCGIGELRAKIDAALRL